MLSMLPVSGSQAVKLLLFAHKPPPHHGQSYMVQMLLNAWGGDQRIQKDTSADSQSIRCFHVDCRLSDGLEDIGRMRLRKLVLLLKYCLAAIGCRFRHGANTFFYCPAPGLRSAVYRDWIIMTLCRPFFKRRVYYWQAAGLAEWLARAARPWERWLTRRLLSSPDLSIVLGEFCRNDGEYLDSGRTEVVPNGVPDPCPDFNQTVLPSRQERAVMRAKLMGEASGSTGAQPRFFEVLFMSLCTTEKGLFDAIEAVALANATLAQARAPLRLRLSVAGKFMFPEERNKFDQRISQPDSQWTLPGSESSPIPLVRYLGFVSGEEKDRLFRESDCFCFPSYYLAEGVPVTLVEAMAYGLDVITTNWRALPEILPPGYAGMVEPKSPAQLARMLERGIRSYPTARLRERFLSRFTDQACVAGVNRAVLALEKSEDSK